MVQARTAVVVVVGCSMILVLPHHGCWGISRYSGREGFLLPYLEKNSSSIKPRNVSFQLEDL